MVSYKQSHSHGLISLLCPLTESDNSIEYTDILVHYEKRWLRVYADSEGPNQPMRLHSMIRDLAVR